MIANNEPDLTDKSVEILLSESRTEAETLQKGLSDGLGDLQNVEDQLKSYSVEDRNILESELNSEFHLWLILASFFTVLGVLVSYILLANVFSVKVIPLLVVLIPVFSSSGFSLFYMYYKLEYRDFKGRIAGIITKSNKTVRSELGSLMSKYQWFANITLKIISTIGSSFPLYASTIKAFDFESRLETERRSLLTSLRVYNMASEDLVRMIESRFAYIKELLTDDPRVAILSIINSVSKKFRFDDLSLEDTVNILKFVYYERIGSIEKENVLKKILEVRESRLFLEGKIAEKINHSDLDKIILDDLPEILETRIREGPSFILENIISTVIEDLHARNEFLSDLRDFIVKFRLERIDLYKIFEEVYRDNHHGQDGFRDTVITYVERDVKQFIIPRLPENTVKTLFELEKSSHTINEWQSAKGDGSFRKGLIMILSHEGILDADNENEYPLEYDDVLETFPDYNLKEIADGLEKLRSLILYEKQIKTKLEQLGILITVETGISVSVYNESKKKRHSLDNLDPYGHILEMSLDFAKTPLNEIPVDKQMEFSSYLSAILINFDNSVQNAVKYMKINREIASNRQLVIKLFNFRRNTGSDYGLNNLEIIMRSFTQEDYSKSEASIFDKFVDYMSSSGFIPSYQGLFESNLIESRKAVSELSSMFDEIDDVRNDFITKLLSTEINEKYLILLRGHTIEAYLLNADTKGNAFQTLGDNLENYRQFLEKEYSVETNDQRMKPSNFLYTRMAGKASRIGVVPPDLTFDQFASLFESSIKEFANKSGITSNLYLSKIDVLPSNLKVVSFAFFSSDNYLDKIGTIINEDFDSKRKVELISTLNAGKISSVSVKTILLKKIDEVSRGLYEFLSDKSKQLLKEVQIGPDEFKKTELYIESKLNLQSLSNFLFFADGANKDSKDVLWKISDYLQRSFREQFPQIKVSDSIIKAIIGDTLAISKAVHFLR